MQFCTAGLLVLAFCESAWAQSGSPSEWAHGFLMAAGILVVGFGGMWLLFAAVQGNMGPAGTIRGGAMGYTVESGGGQEVGDSFQAYQDHGQSSAQSYAELLADNSNQS